MTKIATGIFKAKAVAAIQERRAGRALKKMSDMLNGVSGDFDGVEFKKAKELHYRMADKAKKTRQMADDKPGKVARNLIDKVKGFFSGSKKSVKRKTKTAREFIASKHQHKPALAMA
jgi:hypothetical protein